MRQDSTVVVSEVFDSVQGEGPWIGTPMTFVRLAHCQIVCSFCDTPQRLIGKAMTLPSLNARLGPVLRNRRVCLTGGEPLLQAKQILPFVLSRIGSGERWHLETNGLVTPVGVGEGSLLEFEGIAVSPKLPSAQVVDAVVPLARAPVWDGGAFAAWCAFSQKCPDRVFFKFVVGNLADWSFLDRVLPEIPCGVQAVVQPNTYMPDAYAWFAEGLTARLPVWAVCSGATLPGVRPMPRLQTLLWGDTPGH